MPNVTLYQLPTVVQLTQNNAVSVGTVLNRTDFNLHKNVTNEVEFLIKDIDRKPSNLTGKSLLIYIVDNSTNQLVIQSELVIINALRGHCRMVLTDSELAVLSLGYYRYAVTFARSSDQVLVYTDQHHSLRGYCEVFEGPIPGPVAALSIPASDFSPQSWGVPQANYLVTGSYAGAAQRDNRAGTHTLALYSDQFNGTVWVQGSLNNDAPNNDGDWFPITDVEVLDTATVTGVSFTGNYMWVRFYYQPAAGNTGTVTKALFKN